MAKAPTGGAKLGVVGGTDATEEDLIGGAEPAPAKGKKTNAAKPAGIAAKQLKTFIERVERLDEEIKGLADDKKEIFSEMKGQGFDVKVVRKVIRERKVDAADRAEEEAVLDLYRHALGMA